MRPDPLQVYFWLSLPVENVAERQASWLSDIRWLLPFLSHSTFWRNENEAPWLLCRRATNWNFAAEIRQFPLEKMCKWAELYVWHAQPLLVRRPSNLFSQAILHITHMALCNHRHLPNEMGYFPNNLMQVLCRLLSRARRYSTDSHVYGVLFLLIHIIGFLAGNFYQKGNFWVLFMFTCCLLSLMENFFKALHKHRATKGKHRMKNIYKTSECLLSIFFFFFFTSQPVQIHLVLCWSILLNLPKRKLSFL